MQNKMPPIILPKIDFTREFAFSDQEFERIRQLIYKEAGIALNPTKKDMVYGRLVRRIRELKLNSLEMPMRKVHGKMERKCM